MDENNIEAWEAYQLASIDAMGISLQGVKIICEFLGLKDPGEIFLKIAAILQGKESKER